jgi:hypothetical protein
MTPKKDFTTEQDALEYEEWLDSLEAQDWEDKPDPREYDPMTDEYGYFNTEGPCHEDLY